jgi:hypothetical protein
VCKDLGGGGVSRGTERKMYKIRLGAELLGNGGDVAYIGSPGLSEEFGGMERSQSLRGHATSSPACSCMVIVQSLRIIELSRPRVPGPDEPLFSSTTLLVSTMACMRAGALTAVDARSTAAISQYHTTYLRQCAYRDKIFCALHLRLSSFCKKKGAGRR